MVGWIRQILESLLGRLLTISAGAELIAAAFFSHWPQPWLGLFATTGVVIGVLGLVFLGLDLARLFKQGPPGTGTRDGGGSVPQGQPESQPPQGPVMRWRGVKLINNGIGLLIGRGAKPNIDMEDVLFEGNKKAIDVEGDEPSEPTEGPSAD